MTVPFCEIFAKTLLPALKAMIARELVNTYGLTQWSAAKVLGTTQPLINYYISGKRGSKLLNNLSRSEEVTKFVKDVSRMIVEGRVDSGPFICKLCAFLRDNITVLRDLGITGDFTYPECVE